MLTARKYLTRHNKPTDVDVPDVSLMKDSVSLTSSSSGDSSDEEDKIEVVCSDDTVKAGCKSKKDSRGRLDALLSKVQSGKSSGVKSQVYIHKIEDVKPKKRPNDIIWTAYATTGSFKAIIGGVVKVQAVARRWLVLKEKWEVMRLEDKAATKIQTVWRARQLSLAYSSTLRGKRSTDSWLYDLAFDQDSLNIISFGFNQILFFANRSSGAT